MGNFSAGKLKLMDVTFIRAGNSYILFPKKFDPINAGK
jgi:hypothetical protein